MANTKKSTGKRRGPKPKKTEFVKDIGRYNQDSLQVIDTTANVDNIPLLENKNAVDDIYNSNLKRELDAFNKMVCVLKLIEKFIDYIYIYIIYIMCICV